MAMTTSSSTSVKPGDTLERRVAARPQAARTIGRADRGSGGRFSTAYGVLSAEGQGGLSSKLPWLLYVDLITNRQFRLAYKPLTEPLGDLAGRFGGEARREVSVSLRRARERDIGDSTFHASMETLRHELSGQA